MECSKGIVVKTNIHELVKCYEITPSPDRHFDSIIVEAGISWKEALETAEDVLENQFGDGKSWDEISRELAAATERNGNLSVELAAVTQERDALRRVVAKLTDVEIEMRANIGMNFQTVEIKAAQAGKDVTK